MSLLSQEKLRKLIVWPPSVIVLLVLSFCVISGHFTIGFSLFIFLSSCCSSTTDRPLLHPARAFDVVSQYSASRSQEAGGLFLGASRRSAWQSVALDVARAGCNRLGEKADLDLSSEKTLKAKCLINNIPRVLKLGSSSHDLLFLQNTGHSQD